MGRTNFLISSVTVLNVKPYFNFILFKKKNKNKKNKCPSWNLLLQIKRRVSLTARGRGKRKKKKQQLVAAITARMRTGERI